MAINTSILKAYGKQSTLTKSLREAKLKNKQTAFLCHSHKDEDMAKGLQNLLVANGWDIYIDWQDVDLPETPNEITADKIRSKITESDWFMFLATANSRSSRWCPWEIGFADNIKRDKLIIIPTEGNDGWEGNEYLGLYKRLNKGKIEDKESYGIFEANNNYGVLIDNI